MAPRRRPPLACAIALAAALAWPAVASANMGTPLIWLSQFHLFLGSLAIGFGEAFFLRLLFRAPAWRATAILIGANYTSTLAGVLVLGFASRTVDRILGGGIAAIPARLAAMAVLCYALTLVIEWPFVLAALGSRPRRIRDSVLGSLAVQTASYAVLAVLYFGVSERSFFGALDLDGGLPMRLDPRATVFCISEEGDAFLRLPLGGPAPERVAGIAPPASGSAWLTVWRSEGGFRLALRDERDVVDVALPVFPDPEWRFPIPETDNWHTWRGDLRDEDRRDWAVSAVPFAGSGFIARNEKTGERIEADLATPLLGLPFSKATVLPGDIVILQAGGEVCAIDLEARKIAPLCRGRSPVVGIRRAPAETPEPARR